MDNYNSKWRIWAKVVAFVDLISSIIELLATLILTFLAAATTQAVVNPDTKVPPEAGVFAWLVWLGVVILAILTAVDMWAAIQLIKGTAWGRDAEDAHKCCQSWKVVCIVFFVFDLIYYATTAVYVRMAIKLLIRAVFLAIVGSYMKELKNTIIAAPPQMNESQKV